MTQSCQISQNSIHRHFYWATRFVRQVCDFNRWNLLFPPLKMDHIHLTKKKVEISRQTFSWFLSCQHYRTEPSTRVCDVLQPAFTKFKNSISNHFILTSQTIETEYLASETVISWEPGLTRLTSSLHTHSHTKKGKKKISEIFGFAGSWESPTIGQDNENFTLFDFCRTLFTDQRL